jgi:hypothetical protein
MLRWVRFMCTLSSLVCLLLSIDCRGVESVSELLETFLTVVVLLTDVYPAMGAALMLYFGGCY